MINTKNNGNEMIPGNSDHSRRNNDDASDDGQKVNRVRDRVVIDSGVNEHSINQMTSPIQKTLGKNETEVKEFGELNESRNSENVEANLNQNIVLTVEEAQIFYITPNGEVSAPSYPSKLTISITNVDENNHETSGKIAELQVGTWSYSLLADQSPAFKSDYGSYIFPDIEMGPDHAVGIILPPSTSESDKKRFQNLIEEYSILKIARADEWNNERTGSEKVAENIEKC